MSGILLICDAPSNFSEDKDTTRAIVELGWERGHELWWADKSDLYFEDRLLVVARAMLPRSEDATIWLREGISEACAVDDFDLVLVRSDPPVDAAYQRMLQLLALATVPVLNPPAALLLHNEKLSALRFLEHMPHTIVASDVTRLTDFQETQGKGVYKSLDSLGGEGVFRFEDPQGLQNARAFGGEQPVVMAQAWIDGVDEGDKRVILIDGSFAGVVLRVPPAGEFRSNFHVGGTPAPTELTPGETAIVEEVGTWLREQNILLAGLDLVGGFLTEINITSPTGFREIVRLGRDNPTEAFWHAVEHRLGAE